MKKVFQVLSVLLGMIFIVSTTGILIYKTNCRCTGNEQVSIYIMPESCENVVHRHHKHDNCGCEVATTEKECHECSYDDHNCGCSTPEIRFFKLMNPVSQNEFSFEVLQPVQIFIAISTLVLNLQQKIENELVNFYIDPPHLVSSSKSFLIEVNQLKIPFSA
ncbi:MAG TPA: hypothetical protein VLA03_08275 [Draconibacterium sp.]|nr:hypothetical protein [Draconibacterium sp.]